MLESINIYDKINLIEFQIKMINVRYFRLVKVIICN